MGFVILVVIGGILGWLASIIMRTDDRQGILLNASIGIGAALVAGLLASSESILTGLSASALLISFAGAICVLALVNVLRDRLPG